jgi:hypothetical protein
LDLLKEFSFGSDGGRNDDFRFLELPEIGSADISHAGRNRTDQVLASIIDICRAE